MKFQKLQNPSNVYAFIQARAMLRVVGLRIQSRLQLYITCLLMIFGGAAIYLFMMMMIKESSELLKNGSFMCLCVIVTIMFFYLLIVVIHYSRCNFILDQHRISLSYNAILIQSSVYELNTQLESLINNNNLNDNNEIKSIKSKIKELQEADLAIVKCTESVADSNEVIPYRILMIKADPSLVATLLAAIATFFTTTLETLLSKEEK